MKIGVLSDTHLDRVNEGFKEIYDKYLSDKDLILHAGDVVSTDIIDFLSMKSFHGVCGNMDPSNVQDVLPSKKIIKIGAYRIGVIHGWGGHRNLEERIRSEFKDVDVIIYGHSHQPVCHERNGILFFNPGTATGFSSLGLHSIGVLEVDDTIRGEIIEL